HPVLDGMTDVDESLHGLILYGSGVSTAWIMRLAVARSDPRRAHRSLSLTSFASIFSGMTLKARVRKGRLVVDEPTDLPEGTEIELLPMDPGDWLDEEDRAALHRALVASNAGIEAGELIDASEVVRELRSR
ncbi:MAG TPA: hypothetical protein VJ826_07270, partial [Candidatus Polarisedimenticolaceae bacterium]|nr:hypothetical protein [Candidatus Polarisedimenticolaceae bacterium]